MKQFYLAEIVTKDKLIHQGIFFRPKKPGKKAILYVHGLTSTFYGNIKMLEAFAEGCQKSGFGFAAFNNRGHDIVTGIKKIDSREPKGYAKVSGGAGSERFEDCVCDIDAGISFLAKQGYSEIILAGHSTGANKVCYYAGIKKDPKVKGVILLSPVSDRLDPTLDKEKTAKLVTDMKKMIDDGQGDELLSGVHAFPVTPWRFVSLYAPHAVEDVFDYGDAMPTLTCFSTIIKPLFVLIGSQDEYLHRPVEHVIEVFTKHARSKCYQSVIVPDALHSFNRKEKKVVSAITRWVKEI